MNVHRAGPVEPLQFRVFEWDRARHERHVWGEFSTHLDAMLAARGLADLYALTDRLFFCTFPNRDGGAGNEFPIHHTGCLCFDCLDRRKRGDLDVDERLLGQFAA